MAHTSGLGVFSSQQSSVPYLAAILDGPTNQCGPRAGLSSAASRSSLAAETDNNSNYNNINNSNNNSSTDRDASSLTLCLSLALHPFLAAFDFLRQQASLTLSGDSPHLDIQFSPLVALSCLLYLPVALAYTVNGAFTMGAIMGGIALTSLFSDSLEPSSKLWCRLDRILCALGGLFGPGKAFLLASTAAKKVEVLSLLCVGIPFLVWSRKSRTQEEFNIRHTVWHVASAMLLAWLPFTVPLGP